MNDIEVAIGIVEDVESFWERIPKNKVLAPKGTGAEVAFEHDSIKVMVAARIGSRGGISEHVIAVDSAVTRSIFHRLIMAEVYTGDGFLLNLPAMRAKKRTEEALEVCIAGMHTFLGAVLADPACLIRRIRREAQGMGKSIPTVSGGLPSLGKGSR